MPGISEINHAIESGIFSCEWTHYLDQKAALLLRAGGTHLQEHV